MKNDKTKYDKLAPIIEKLIKLHFKDNIDRVKVLKFKSGSRSIVIVFTPSNQLGIYNTIIIEGRIREILKSVLNLNFWEYELVKKYGNE